MANGIKTLHIDIETFSDVDLKEHGLYPYAKSPYFEILSFAVSINGEPVKVYDVKYSRPKEVGASCFSDCRTIQVLRLT